MPLIPPGVPATGTPGGMKEPVQILSGSPALAGSVRWIKHDVLFAFGGGASMPFGSGI